MKAPNIENLEHRLVEVVYKSIKHIWCGKCVKKRVKKDFPTYRDKIYYIYSIHGYPASFEKIVCEDCGHKNENPNLVFTHYSWYDYLHRFPGGRARKHVRRAKRRANNYGGHGY